MNKFVEPSRDTVVSNKLAVAAIGGFVPAVVIQDQRGHQVVITAQMARTLAKDLPEMADLAEKMSTGDVSDHGFYKKESEGDKCPIL